jgi:NDP-mannose synthase
MRLRPYTTILPKPLVPIGDRPILELIIRRLAAIGVRDIDLCIGHLGELIRVYFSQGTTLPDGLRLHWHWEDGALGTAGALRMVPGLDSTFIAMNGDVLTTLDLRALIEHHRREGATLTIGMKRRQVSIDLGVIETDNGRVVGYREKPTLPYDVSMGVYVYEPRALQFLPDGPCQFPDLVLRLLEAGEPVVPFQSDAEWYDIGTPSEYERAVREYERDPALFAF